MDDPHNNGNIYMYIYIKETCQPISFGEQTTMGKRCDNENKKIKIMLMHAGSTTNESRNGQYFFLIRNVNNGPRILANMKAKLGTYVNTKKVSYGKTRGRGRIGCIEFQLRDCVDIENYVFV